MRIEQQDDIKADSVKSIIRDGHDAQRGSLGAEKDILNTIGWAEAAGILNGVVKELGNKVKTTCDKAGNPTEIKFEAIPGYPQSVTVDLLNHTVNSRNIDQLSKDQDAEQKEFIEKLVDSKSRPVPAGESGMTDGQKDITRILENALVNGDLAALGAAFQGAAQDQNFWSRVNNEVSADFAHSKPLLYGTKMFSNGQLEQSYLLMNVGEAAVVIPATGQAQVYQLDGMGKVDFSRRLAEDASHDLLSVSIFTSQYFAEKVSQYRNEFFEHEGSKVNQVPSLTQIIEAHNSYGKH